MEVKKHILLAEDDSDFGGILKQYLEISGFQVTWAKDGEEALGKFNKGVYSICVLDVMMPKMDGFTLAEQIIEINPEVPFLFLTARKMKEDKIKGLKLGADDYVVKPFEADELVLRIQNILKRSQRQEYTQPVVDEVLEIGAYSFDTRRLILTHGSTEQKLTQREGALVQFLYSHRNQLLRREEILKAVWNNDDFFSGRSMDVFISKLRKYFKEDPSIRIESIRGIGLEFKIS
ncbi:MAG: response regulator transcription factor [Flavobacteriaceae bacterium]|nr:response regulator transcription factor [Flavobacteriaceae bacterium]